MSTVALSVVNNITATASQTAVGGTANDPIIGLANNAILPGTGSFVPPVGTTGQRLLQGAGSLRFNTTTGFFEGSTDGATWVNLAVGGGGIASVTGTAGRITTTAGPNVVVNIDPTYVGQNTITTLGTITTGVWNGTAINETHGGTNQTSYALGDTLYASGANTLAKLPGNITAGIRYLAQTGTGVVSAAPAWTTISGGDITGAALTTGNDTNVTLTAGGTPLTSLLRAASITAGWAGQLSLARGGTNAALVADNGAIPYSTAGALALLASTATANQIIMSGSHAAPSWSTATYPATTTINQLLYSSAANTITGLATANRAVITTGATGIPVATALAVDGQLIIGSTAGAPAAATLTAGAGVTITNASNSITISATGSGGTVTNVTGVAPIASSGGNTPAISLNGTATAGQVLQSVTATTTAYSTPTYPSASGSAGTVLRSNGTNNIYSTSTFADTYLASNLLYSNGANTVTGLATANNGVLVTSAGGVPSISSTLPPGLTGYVTTGFTLLSLNKFTSTGTWTKPAGCTAVMVELVGGGGGGGGVSSAATATIAGGAGGGGGYCRLFINGGLGGTETVTIGAAGTAGTSAGGNGGNGGTTSFGAHCQATGGNGGLGSTTGTYGTVGAGGIGSSGDINLLGGTGGYSSAGAFTTGGGNSFFGTGGLTFYYTGGHAGVDASGFGGGGQAAIADHVSGFAGGAGTAGFCIVYNYGNS